MNKYTIADFNKDFPNDDTCLGWLKDYLYPNGIDCPKYLDDIVDVTKRFYGYDGNCPNAENCSKAVLIIPNHYILSMKKIEYIAECLNDSVEYRE